MSIKLVIFDLDGVLVDARELHYKALNQALSSIDERFVISREEHLSTFDGLSTFKKLDILQYKRGLKENYKDIIWKLKQEKTLSIIDQFTPDEKIKNILKYLKREGYLTACCTN